MSSLTAARKQREFEQREELILNTAREMVLKRGYLGMTMDRIAEAIEYSKGTVYLHFANKEDLLAALVVQTEAKRCELYERAASFDGRPREKMMAVGEAYEIFNRRYPHHFRSEQIIRATSIREKISSERLAELKKHERTSTEIGLNLIRIAIIQGDLKLPEGFHPEELLFAMWSMVLGSFTLLHSEGVLESLGDLHPGRAIGQSFNAMMDGFGWKPLLGEWDYRRTFQRIYEEIFPEEERVMN